MEMYSTLSRKIQDLKVDNNSVYIYCCGPTVYGMPHVGNFRTFFLGDLIRRVLKFRGFDVLYVMNITDIDDKTIRDSKKENLSLTDFTEKYTKEFFRGCEWLRIEPADIHPKATDHIPEMIELVEKLEAKGIAYEKNGSVYFSIEKFPTYGDLAQLKMENLALGKSVDVDEYEKDNPADFVLWKAAKEDEIQRGIYWDSPWGKGRPGWHLECSILSTKYLGIPIDMHLGGVDLIFPHHTNEIAQSEGADDSIEPFVRYWIHGEHLIVDGKKMSKSAGNYFTMDNLAKENPDTVRMYFLNTHYRDVLNFTFDSLKQVDSQRERIQKLLDDLHSELTKKNKLSTTNFNEFDEHLHNELSSLKQDIINALDKDLSTPLAMKKLNNMVRSINSYLQNNENNLNYSSLIFAYSVIREILDVFGLFPEKSGGYDPEFVENLIQNVIGLRASMRKEKQWKIADEIRDMLNSVGIELKDLKEETRWRRIDS